MKKPWFWTAFSSIILLSLAIRIVPPIGNNFYFTMDAGRDAVYIRDMLIRFKFPLLGPVTSIDGLYDGPFWYYFLAPGYIIFRGHPFGAVFMMISASIATTGYLMITVRKYISPLGAIITGAALQILWIYYDASRFAFNPYILVFLAILLVLFLAEAFGGDERKYFLVAISAGLAFQADIAGGIAFLIFFILAGIWGKVTGKISWSTLLSGCIVLGFFFLPHIISEFQTDFLQTHVYIKELESPKSVFAQTGLRSISWSQLVHVAKGIFRQISVVEILSFLAAALFAFLNRRKIFNGKLFIPYFILLTLGLCIITLIWFSLSTGWRVYQTLYVIPLLFMSYILMVSQFPKPAALFFIVIATAFSGTHFIQQYRLFFRPNDDPSLLVNELTAVDWTYRQSNDQGFYVYSYLPSVYDYPYQYLYWWHGKDTYGYVPCEYSSYPGSPKLIVPGSSFYTEPRHACGQDRYLIVEPDPEDPHRQDVWLTGVRAGSEFVDSYYAGKILVEKRRIK